MGVHPDEIVIRVYLKPHLRTARVRPAKVYATRSDQRFRKGAGAIRQRNHVLLGRDRQADRRKIRRHGIPQHRELSLTQSQPGLTTVNDNSRAAERALAQPARTTRLLMRRDTTREPQTPLSAEMR